MTAWILGIALAVEPAHLDALEREMSRQQGELSLPQAPPMYLLRYHLVTLDNVGGVVSDGGIVRWSESPANGLGVEVRVGSPSFDNTGLGGWQTGFSRSILAEDLTAESLATSAWSLTDQAYKEAVEQHARKQAQYTPPEDHPGDYQMTGAHTAATERPPGIDASALQQLALDLSTRMAAVGPLTRSEVHVGHETGVMWTADTEGTRVARPVAETTLRALAHVRTEDGSLLTDDRLWCVGSPDALPEAEWMAVEAEEMARALLALAEAPSLDEEVVGPVIFEGNAASHLFRELLVPQLEGTPAEIPFDSLFGNLGADKDSVRTGRRVLPPGWEASDDPQRWANHPSGFAYDYEGTPSQPVHLVSDGIVQDLLMSRIPRKGHPGTNGHARTWLGERPEARVSQLSITPPKSQSDRALHAKASRLAASYDRDWYLVVRRLQEPAVTNLGGSFSFFGGDDGPTLPAPVAVYRVWSDGREEALRDAAFSSVNRWLLRDIVAAGAVHRQVWLAGVGQLGSGTTSGLPTMIEAPTVLVGEVEIVPSSADPRDAHGVPAP